MDLVDILLGILGVGDADQAACPGVDHLGDSARPQREDGVEFVVEGDEDAQITIGLNDDTQYEVFVNGKSVGTMTTGLGGKLSLSVELEAAGEVPVKVQKA